MWQQPMGASGSGQLMAWMGCWQGGGVASCFQEGTGDLLGEDGH